MSITLRQELEHDYSSTEQVVERAFRTASHTNHAEQFLVARLRKSDAFIPELSLVAELDGAIVGHVMFTRLVIRDDQTEHASLAMAPVSVLPEHQGQGIGSQMIMTGLEKARQMGFTSVIVLGHKDYYPRFGFRPASQWGIRAPFPVSDASYMALELQPQGLQGVSGVVVYPKAFDE